MELKEAKKFIEERIKELEKGTYTFEEVLKPRYDADKRILEKLREQHLKLNVLIQKMNEGQEVTQQDVYDCVPPSFR